ncbi:MAG: hypothetical protein IPN77_10810 [Sandaracinaceae bacterium]|nr:hypothetical protein [Sandaracinaceae bacterium]
MSVVIPLMADNVGYDNFVVRAPGGAELPFTITSQSATVGDFRARPSGGLRGGLPRGVPARGPAPHGARRRPRARLPVVDTDFREVDFPPSSLSPSEHSATGGGWHGSGSSTR